MVGGDSNDVKYTVEHPAGAKVAGLLVCPDCTCEDNKCKHNSCVFRSEMHFAHLRSEMHFAHLLHCAASYEGNQPLPSVR